MARTIYFASAGGGAGSTTCAVGVGMALARRGERTLVADGGRLAAAAHIAGCEGGLYTLADAAGGGCRVKQAIAEHPRLPNFFVLSCAGCTDRNFILEAVRECGGLFDYILCDGVAAAACNRAAVVCTPYPLSVKGADICLNQLRDGGCGEAGIILNKVNGGLIYDGQIMPPRDIAALLKAPLLGVIPEDLEMPLGRMRQDSLKAFKLTAARLAGRGERVFSALRGYVGAGGAIKRAMRRKI